jgi:Lhr-like helicase
LSGDGHCDACVRRAQLAAAYHDSHSGFISVADTRQATARPPARPLRARLAAGVSSRARAREIAAQWLAQVEPNDTGPIDPEPGYELEIARRDEVELTDGSGILVRFSSVTYRFVESRWQQIEQTKIAHRDIAVPAEFPAALPVENLVEAWGDYQAAVAAFNRRVWAAEEVRRETQRQEREAREEAFREQRHTSDLLHEDKR